MSPFIGSTLNVRGVTKL